MFCENSFETNNFPYSSYTESFVDDEGNVLILDEKLLQDQKQVVVLINYAFDIENKQTLLAHDDLQDNMFSIFSQEFYLHIENEAQEAY